jgi:hypothetical protein
MRLLKGGWKGVGTLRSVRMLDYVCFVGLELVEMLLTLRYRL